MKRMFTGVHEFVLRDLRKFELIGPKIRGGSRTTATSKEELFVIIINGWKPLTIITKRSILDVTTVLDPPLISLIHLNSLSIRNKIWKQSLKLVQLYKISNCHIFYSRNYFFASNPLSKPINMAYQWTQISHSGLE